MESKTRLVIEENTIYEIDEECLLKMQELQEKAKKAQDSSMASEKE